MARTPAYQPIPPREMPPARTVLVPGRGEFFLRDSDPTHPGPVVLLLHGWMVSADLNWHTAYGALADAGYRVLALDHRGHARGLRALAPFRLTDCADDAAAVLRTLEIDQAIAVGYSMGGTIAQLLARDHRQLLSGLVLSGTCQHFQDPETVKIWRWMGVVGLLVKLAPKTFFRAGFRRGGIELNEHTAWWMAELMRHSGRDVAEAGRELGRFDSRPWLRGVSIPAAIVLTGRDTAVSPAKQRELALATGATVFEVGLDHLELTDRADEYNPALLSALQSVEARAGIAAGPR
ncbi:MAG: alpha/beta fold hydrolase [Solirubrobacteraceae bacterium]